MEGQDDGFEINMETFKKDNYFVAINTVISLLCFVSFATLLAAGTTDPGIIPRQYDNKAGEQYPQVYKEQLEKEDARKKYLINKKLLAKKMDQRDFTKNYRNTSKVDHEGGDSIDDEKGDFEKDSIGEDDERNSPQDMGVVKIDRLDQQSPKRSRTVTDGFRSKAAVEPPIIKI